MTPSAAHQPSPELCALILYCSFLEVQKLHIPQKAQGLTEEDVREQRVSHQGETAARPPHHQQGGACTGHCKEERDNSSIKDHSHGLGGQASLMDKRFLCHCRPGKWSICSSSWLSNTPCRDPLSLSLIAHGILGASPAPPVQSFLEGGAAEALADNFATAIKVTRQDSTHSRSA